MYITSITFWFKTTNKTVDAALKEYTGKHEHCFVSREHNDYKFLEFSINYHVWLSAKEYVSNRRLLNIIAGGFKKRNKENILVGAQ